MLRLGGKVVWLTTECSILACQGQVQFDFQKSTPRGRAVLEGDHLSIMSKLSKINVCCISQSIPSHGITVCTYLRSDPLISQDSSGIPFSIVSLNWRLRSDNHSCKGRIRIPEANRITTLLHISKVPKPRRSRE